MSMQKISLFIFVSLITMQAQANTYISSGVYYLNGQNNLTDQSPVTSWSVPFSVSTYQDAWQYSISTSLNRMTTEQNEVSKTVNGLGDTYLRLGYEWIQQPSITGALIYKLATGDADKGLSTGKDDLGLQVQLYQPIKQRSSVFGHLGYSFNGKVTGSDIQNTGSASIGLGHQLSSNLLLAVSTSYQQSLYQSLDDQVSVEASLSVQLSPLTSFGVFAGYDNTETTTLGLSISRKL